MKSLLLFITATMVCLIAGIGSVQAQCNTDDMAKKGSARLGEYTFLKSYKVEAKPGEPVEYSYVFSGNTSYMVALADDKGGEVPNVEVTMYDNSRKMVSTNKIGGKLYPAIVYNCKATGIYYMTFTVQPGASCGVGILGFKK